jgi:hypothetical protein
MKTSKIIFSPQLAQYLLQCGYTIIDLKPKHDAERETVFVFKYEKGLEEAILNWAQDK